MTAVSVSLSVVVTIINLRNATEREVQSQMIMLAKAFRNEILSGEYKTTELQIAALLGLGRNEYVKIVDSNFRNLYASNNDVWPEILRQQPIFWNGLLRLEAAAPIFFDQETTNLFGYIVVDRRPKINWTLLVSVLLSLLIGQTLFAIFYRAGVLHIGTHLSNQLAGLSQDLSGQLGGVSAAVEIAELNIIRGAFQKVQSEIEALKEHGTNQKDLRQVAHDIRSPLTALSIGIQSLKEVPLATRSLLEAAYKRMDSIAGEILSQRPPGFETVPCVDVQRQLQVLISEKVTEHQSTGVSLHLETLASATSYAVAINPAAFQRAISNLLNNAIEATPPGGAVTVRCERKLNHLAVQIVDQGEGIPESLQRAILAGGYTSKAGGHGLGVSGAKHFAEISGGTLRFFKSQHQFIVELQLPVLEES